MKMRVIKTQFIKVLRFYLAIQTKGIKNSKNELVYKKKSLLFGGRGKNLTFMFAINAPQAG